jgi:hypothetical protein
MKTYTMLILFLLNVTSIFAANMNQLLDAPGPDYRRLAGKNAAAVEIIDFKPTPKIDLQITPAFSLDNHISFEKRFKSAGPTFPTPTGGFRVSFEFTLIAEQDAAANP